MRFEGVRVLTLNFGKFKKGAAMTIPGIGIFVGPDDAANLDLLRHEFGHILQYRKWGFFRYWWRVVPASLRSARQANRNLKHTHMHTWTEWSANLMAYHYFGEPGDWLHERYPTMPENLA